MTQDEIIEMARDIATQASKVGPYRTWTHEYAMSLIMQLVDASAAKERERIYFETSTDFVKSAVAAEREACALICEKEQEQWGWDSDVMDAAKEIRARGET